MSAFEHTRREDDVDAIRCQAEHGAASKRRFGGLLITRERERAAAL